MLWLAVSPDAFMAGTSEDGMFGSEVPYVCEKRSFQLPARMFLGFALC